MRKAGGPRRPDAEQSPTLRRQCTKQVVRGVPTRNKDGRSLVAHAAPGGHGPPSDCNAQGRWSAASRRGTKLAGDSLLMPRPEVTAHPATAKCKAGSAASRRGTKLAGHSLLMPHLEVAAHPATAKRKAGGPRRPDAEQSRQVTRCSCRTRRSRPTQRRQCAGQVVRGVPTRNKDGRSLVAHAAPGGHGPPSDCKVQGRWSAASRRGTKSAGHSLLMPRPEVAAHPPSDGNAQGRWSAASRRGTNTRSIFRRVSYFLKSKTQRIDWRLRLRVTTVERDSDGWLGRPASTLPQGW